MHYIAISCLRSFTTTQVGVYGSGVPERILWIARWLTCGGSKVDSTEIPKYMEKLT